MRPLITEHVHPKGHPHQNLWLLISKPLDSEEKVKDQNRELKEGRGYVLL